MLQAAALTGPVIEACPGGNGGGEKGAGARGGGRAHGICAAVVAII